MFVATDSLEHFRKWIAATRDATEHDHRLSFFVAYASLERYLFRIALALLVFSGWYTAEARRRLKKYDLTGLAKLCSNPRVGGNAELMQKLKLLGLSLGALRNRRNGIAHGFDLGGYSDVGDIAGALWKLLHEISEIEFGEGHPQAPYGAWKRLPSRRRVRVKKVTE